MDTCICSSWESEDGGWWETRVEETEDGFPYGCFWKKVGSSRVPLEAFLVVRGRGNTGLCLGSPFCHTCLSPAPADPRSHSCQLPGFALTLGSSSSLSCFLSRSSTHTHPHSWISIPCNRPLLLLSCLELRMRLSWQREAQQQAGEGRGRVVARAGGCWGGDALTQQEECCPCCLPSSAWDWVQGGEG